MSAGSTGGHFLSCNFCKPDADPVENGPDPQIKCNINIYVLLGTFEIWQEKKTWKLHKMQTKEN